MARRWSFRGVLLVAIPLSLLAWYVRVDPRVVLGVACLAIVPLAGFMGEATEAIAGHTTPAIGGLLNATFGNAAELIIAIVALRAGLVDLVKASITGSILGNLLLIMGLSFIVGGARTPVLTFNRTSAGMSSAMLALAVCGLVFPALYQVVATHPDGAALLHLSESVAVILALTYLASLLFSLRTHKALFGGPSDQPARAPDDPSLRRAVLVLALATLGIVVESELLVTSVESITTGGFWSQTFLGLILIPIIGNAAEHTTAVVFARAGKTDLALQVALGSSTQVALFVAPLLVLAGVLLRQPMNLAFTPFEIVALGLATLVVAIITLDGESHWFEGVQLVALYGVIAATACFV